MIDLDDNYLQRKPLKDRTPNPLASVCGSLTYAKAQLAELANEAQDEEDKAAYHRAASFLARALQEIEP